MTSASPVAFSAPDRVRNALSKREWVSLATVAGVVTFLHLVGWGGLVATSSHDSQAGSSGVLGFGLGVTAYTLGLRHAFDADHIAAIDNTTRKLMNEGGRPLSVGFWFSLGHSSIVFGLCALLAAGVRALTDQVPSDSSTFRAVVGLVGAGVSGTFLLVIGLLNLAILVNIVRGVRRMRQGDAVENLVAFQAGGLMSRLFSGASRIVTKPWHMYVVGLLFGLGFDTATEVGLLVLAGGAAAFSLPWYAILILPILFAAGMTLLDSIDGCFMNFAYGWALFRPARKVYYNLVITALSVAVALILGSLQLLSILVRQAGIDTGPLSIIGRLDLGNVGYIAVALFGLAWAVAVVVWRFGHIEDKWSREGASTIACSNADTGLEAMAGKLLPEHPRPLHHSAHPEDQ